MRLSTSSEGRRSASERQRITSKHSRHSKSASPCWWLLVGVDELIVGAMRAVLSQAYGINLRNGPEPKLARRFMRFMTVDGVFDCLATKDAQLKVLAISVIRRLACLRRREANHVARQP